MCILSALEDILFIYASCESLLEELYLNIEILNKLNWRFRELKHKKAKLNEPRFSTHFVATQCLHNVHIKRIVI